MSQETAMLDRRDTALRIYFDATDTIRHYDGERMATHRIALTLLGALLAFAGSDFFRPQMTVTLAVFGVFGSLIFFLLSLKFGALIFRERSRAQAARQILKELGDATIVEIDTRKNENYRKVQLSGVRTGTLWTVFYLLLVIGFTAIGSLGASI